MNAIALKILPGDRAKYLGLLFGITDTSFVVIFAGSQFGGIVTGSFALIAESPADAWIMDRAGVAIDRTINLPSSGFDPVRSVEAVLSAGPLALAAAENFIGDAEADTLLTQRPSNGRLAADTARDRLVDE
jgi:putative ABC transport system permease protein